MPLAGFPNQIQVTLGTFFNGDAVMCGLNSGDILVLTKVGDPAPAAPWVWTENGTDVPNKVTNRIKFNVNKGFGVAVIKILGANTTNSTVWGGNASYQQGFFINNANAGFNVGTIYTFKEVWLGTTASITGMNRGPYYNYFDGKYNDNVFSAMSEYTPPVADFTSDHTHTVAPLTAQFTDTSTNTPTSWDWDFGDGSPHSTLQNPVHIYSAGTYTVTLTATNSYGSDTVVKTNYIRAWGLVNFPNQIQVIMGAQFDGDAQRYRGLKSGDILVLTKLSGSDVWTEDGTDVPNTTTNRIKFAPKSGGGLAHDKVDAFVYGMISSYWGVNGSAGFLFEDRISENAYSFKDIWSFTGVPIASKIKIPNSSFTATSSLNVDYKPNIFSSITVYIPPPVADFTADVTSGTAPLTVQFTDTSTNTPTSWDWDFGDSTAHGTTQNPSHTYTVAGTYTVTLIATNAGGSDSEIKLNYITVTQLSRETADNSPDNTIGMPGTDDETPGNSTGDTKLGSGDTGDVLNRNKIRLLGIILKDEQSGSSNGDKTDNSAGVNHGSRVLNLQGFAGMNVPYQP